MDDFEVELNEEGKIVDFLDGSLLVPRPEELVRQKYLRILHHEYQYPKNVLAKEVPVYYGHSELKDKEGNPVKADIVVFRTAKAKNDRN